MGQFPNRTTAGVVVLLLLAFGGSAVAQNYSFSVPNMMLHVYVNPDASVKMEHEIEFECSPGAHPIDVVDVGLPHSNYDISNMTATVNGQPVSGIKKSTYIACGVEVPLGRHAIRAGQSAQFSFTCTMPDLILQDSTQEQYASLQVTPTWFDSGLLRGTTDLVITIYVPDEIKPEELKYQDERQPYSKQASLESYTAAIWEMPGVRADGEHKVGLSFPKRAVGGNVKAPAPRPMDRPIVPGPQIPFQGAPVVEEMTPFRVLLKWWADDVYSRVLFTVLFFVVFGFAFFRASKGTGWSCFVVPLLPLFILFLVEPVTLLIAFPVLLLLWGLSETALRRRRRKYLPAIVSVEGGGVKRGLTAPEAAVLLELPLSRVLTLVIFGLLKKGIVEQSAPVPLTVRVPPEYRTKSQGARRNMASRRGTVIHKYEHAFLDAVTDAGGAPVQDTKFSSALQQMIEQTALRVKGFDLEQTRAYYRSIVASAWSEAEAIAEEEKRAEHVDSNLLWMLTSDDSADTFERWHQHGYDYRPSWLRPVGTDVSTRPSSGPRATPVTPPGPPATPAIPAGPVGAPAPAGDKTTFSDVAASFAGWLEDTAGGLAAHMDPVSLGVDRGGLFDLAGVDKVTARMLEAMNESSSSGKGGFRGGGSGGGFSCVSCACACAGCACACACAGGGR